MAAVLPLPSPRSSTFHIDGRKSSVPPIFLLLPHRPRVRGCRGINRLRPTAAGCTTASGSLVLSAHRPLLSTKHRILGAVAHSHRLQGWRWRDVARISCTCSSSHPPGPLPRESLITHSAFAIGRPRSRAADRTTGSVRAAADGTKGIPLEDEAGPLHPEGVKLLYVVFLLNCVLERGWRFAQPLLLATADGGFGAIALLGLLTQLTLFVAGPSIGVAMDKADRQPHVPSSRITSQTHLVAPDYHRRFSVPRFKQASFSDDTERIGQSMLVTIAHPPSPPLKPQIPPPWRPPGRQQSTLQ
mmetsp:Transcript_39400/g.111651  ORF Transcript_39400/g.111651 Transcript_39400/m.111651 type:complete len:300 (+) Transcript_39400:219-1118(+)